MRCGQRRAGNNPATRIHFRFRPACCGILQWPPSQLFERWFESESDCGAAAGGGWQENRNGSDCCVCQVRDFARELLCLARHALSDLINQNQKKLFYLCIKN